MSNPKAGALRPFQPCRFARYTLLQPIAKGGMGEVFLAQMTGAGGFEKLIIIKKILPELAKEKDFVDRFLAEAKILVHLHHGSIAQILDMGVEDGSYYIAMEFVDGKDLRKILQRAKERKGKVPVGLALHIIIRILDALAYAHRKTLNDGSELNLVHRDVSPQNILVSYEGDVKLIDFGLAKSSESQKQKTRAGMVVGKIFYMSPEQTVDENVDRRCDLYAAGICLWEMLAGKNPFDTGESALMLMHRVANPEVPSIKTVRPDLPDALDTVLKKAIEPEPRDRFSSAEEMRAALTSVMLSVDAMAGPESLASYMRELFAAEFDKEHKNIAAMLKAAPKAEPEPPPKPKEPEPAARKRPQKRQDPQPARRSDRSAAAGHSQERAREDLESSPSDAPTGFYSQENFRAELEGDASEAATSIYSQESIRADLERRAPFSLRREETAPASAGANSHERRHTGSQFSAKPAKKDPGRAAPASPSPSASRPPKPKEDAGEDVERTEPPEAEPPTKRIDSPAAADSPEAPSSSSSKVILGAVGGAFLLLIFLGFLFKDTLVQLAVSTPAQTPSADAKAPSSPPPPFQPPVPQPMKAPAPQQPQAAAPAHQPPAPKKPSKPLSPARSLLRRSAPPADFKDITMVVDGLSAEFSALRRTHECKDLSLMCDFYESLVQQHQQLQRDASKKIQPEDFGRRRLLLWNDLKTLAKSLSEQEARLASEDK